MKAVRQTFWKKIGDFVSNNMVPVLFVIICAFSIPLSGYSANYLLSEIIVRISRDSFLIVSLLIPIMAGMGLNFGMTLGAMAISVLLGWWCGKILNMAKGREMVTSYIIGFFMNGIYQLVVLYCMGAIIPVRSAKLVLPRGYGIRNTVNLSGIRKSLDNLVSLKIAGISIPIATFAVIVVLCLFVVWFRKTKLGQDMRAVGQDMEVARAAGIKVEETRIISIIISTVLAGYGMIIYLQNMGTLNTYNSHTQVGMFSIAALLVGGASVAKANIRNVFLGVILFHLMFIVSPMAGKNLIGEAQLGEYFRVFVSYGVITLSLVLYEVRKKREANREGQELAADQKEDAR